MRKLPKLRKPSTPLLILQGIFFVLVVGFVILEMVLVFTDRDAFLPLINPDELKLEFGQYAALASAIISWLLTFAHVVGLRGQSKFTLALPLLFIFNF